MEYLKYLGLFLFTFIVPALLCQVDIIDKSLENYVERLAGNIQTFCAYFDKKNILPIYGDKGHETLNTYLSLLLYIMTSALILFIICKIYNYWIFKKSEKKRTSFSTSRQNHTYDASVVHKEMKYLKYLGFFLFVLIFPSLFALPNFVHQPINHFAWMLTGNIQALCSYFDQKGRLAIYSDEGFDNITFYILILLYMMISTLILFSSCKIYKRWIGKKYKP